MTQPKKIATSIKTLMEHPIVLETLNLNSDITPAAKKAMDFWGYDLFNRRPCPAYDEYGIFQGTDLDLACFMYSMVNREAVINIPQYTGMRQKKTRADQVVTSAANRNGKIVGVQANKDFFTFSSAAPGQKGVHHVNCRPKGQWVEQFRPHGFRVREDLRAEWLGKLNVTGKYGQNIRNNALFFTRP